MCDERLFLAFTSSTIPYQGPTLQKISVNMSSELANNAAEIPVAEGVQGTYPKYLVAEVVEALDTEYSEAALFQLGGD